MDSVLDLAIWAQMGYTGAMDLKPRYLTSFLIKDLNEKILILSGPRQAGKTTLAKMLGPDFDYFNYYNTQHRLSIEAQEWRRQAQYLIFDELHAKSDWKRWLKALYESEGLPPGIVVTGSARLEAFRKTGDSLAGCFFPYRLHPLDVKELCQMQGPALSSQYLDALLKFSGFPEPFFKGRSVFYNRWQKTHFEAILREDIQAFHTLKNLNDVQMLIELLRQCVGSCVNYDRLARDIGRDGKTIKSWLSILENFYILFKVLPYSKSVAKSLLKQPKYYFYDTAFVRDKGAAFENLVACSLLKNNHFYEDCWGQRRGLYYLQNKNKNEIDFLLTRDARPTHMIECKWSDGALSSSFDVFSKALPPEVKKIQLVKESVRERSLPNGCQILQAAPWLAQLT